MTFPGCIQHTSILHYFMHIISSVQTPDYHWIEHSQACECNASWSLPIYGEVTWSRYIWHKDRGSSLNHGLLNASLYCSPFPFCIVVLLLFLKVLDQLLKASQLVSLINIAWSLLIPLADMNGVILQCLRWDFSSIQAAYCGLYQIITYYIYSVI